jgi:hypothetical protein
LRFHVRRHRSQAGIESDDTRQRRRDRRLGKIEGDVVAEGPGSPALARLAELEIGETAQRQLMPTRPTRAAQHGPVRSPFIHRQ